MRFTALAPALALSAALLAATQAGAAATSATAELKGADGKTIGTATLTEAPHGVLLQWQVRHPAVQAVLIDALATSMATLARREATLLMDSAERRYQAFIAAEPELARRLPLHQIASYLGITTVALSRIRRRLKVPAAGAAPGP